MSGRSAYVRKKGREASQARPKSNDSTNNGNNRELPSGVMPGLPHDRDWIRERDVLDGVLTYYNETPPYGNQRGGSQSGPSLDSIREGPNTSHLHGPPNEFAYTRARVLPNKTDDVAEIERSGLRIALDKKTDEVRKGLVKAFTFRKKDKEGDGAEPAIDARPESSATVRPAQGAGVRFQDHDDKYDSVIPSARHRGASQGPGSRWNEASNAAMPSNLLPTVAEFSAPPIKRWIGAGRPVQRWNKLRKDPELWDPTGDVLVFLGRRDQSRQLNPSFRLSSHIIEATESRYLLTLLREGSTEEDLHLPSSPAGAPPMLQRYGSFDQAHHVPGEYGLGAQPTPPGSEDNGSVWEMDGQISYEMYLPAPSNLPPLDQLRYHITTRNVFALLSHASLVGFSLFQALTDLHSRLESYMPRTSDNLGTILRYISGKGLDDVRNDPETAVSLLAWSESSEVRWEAGWRESFVHCAGMYTQLETCADFKHVTPITRGLLERVSLETQLRVHAAEERLAEFEYSDMWPSSVAVTANTSGPVVIAPAKAAMDRLQQFFVQYYTQQLGAWPPPVLRSPGGLPAQVGEEEEDIWLSRTVAQLLQKDFAALYDYLVNRDIVWDESEARPSRKWMMVSESGNQGFETDTPDLPMTDMLIEFDNKHRFPHIPYPYPLVPVSIVPSSSPTKEGSAGGMFGGKSAKKNASRTNGGGRMGADERRIQLAYTEATNICILGSDFSHSDLVDAFSKFEKTDHLGRIDPFTARRARWVLIYGILQTLASVSVDAPGIRYKDDVSYHLSPRLKGVKIPPWKTGGPRLNTHEAAHELSHCWTVPATWASSSDASNSEAEHSAGEDGIHPMAYAGGHSRHGDDILMQPMPRISAGQRTLGSVRSRNSSRAPSVASNGGAYSAFSSAGSAASILSYSGSETGSSVRSPTSAAAPASFRRDQRSGRGIRVKVPVAEEHEWAAADHLGQAYSMHGRGGLAPSSGPYATRTQSRMAHGGYPGHGYAHGRGLSELDDLLDEEVEVDGEVFMLSSGGSERERDGGAMARAAGASLARRSLNRGGSGPGPDSVGPMIRDFDELGVID
ncbi:hypothetical protein C8A03DRAFT_10918 [Achaetomium macrosporum]|uniref:DUF8004 domain-containing protein n=1 Tax=Achaetomium macrosporum TaxID=79813 RepID=A0AAN7CIS0_9PEZI|nr:hypothetical protein C8A03DRAFT_10918 [Achaetomium macrosporum]